MLVISTLAVDFWCPRPAEVDQRREQAVDAHRGADGRHLLAQEAHHQIVVAAAAEDRAELRRVEQDRLEHRAGVVGEAAGDREVERHLVVAVAEGVEVVGDPLDGRDLRLRPLDAGEEVAELRPPPRGGRRRGSSGSARSCRPAPRRGRRRGSDRPRRRRSRWSAPAGPSSGRPCRACRARGRRPPPCSAGMPAVGEQRVEDAARGVAHPERPHLQGGQACRTCRRGSRCRRSPRRPRPSRGRTG